jgi:hypothetical protein
MTSFPDNPSDQLLFLIDNPLVAGQPGGKAFIEDFKALLDAVLRHDDGGSSAMAALFGDDLFAASAPVEAAPAGDGGHHHGKGGGGDDGSGLAPALGLFGALVKNELDI